MQMIQTSLGRHYRSNKLSKKPTFKVIDHLIFTPLYSIYINA